MSEALEAGSRNDEYKVMARDSEESRWIWSNYLLSLHGRILLNRFAALRNRLLMFNSPPR
jgi:hypothetical protein